MYGQSRGGLTFPANTKHLYNICTMLDQRRRRWADVVEMLYKYFVFAGLWAFIFYQHIVYYTRYYIYNVADQCWTNVEDVEPALYKC